MEPRMYCSTCGADRTVPAHAASPGPCPECGGTTRSSVRPDYRFGNGVGATGSVVITSNGGGATQGGSQ